MKKHLFFIAAGLLASSIILGVSLLKTAQVRAASFAQLPATNKRFYVGREMKPDHVLFPVKAAVDQAKLATASPENQVSLSLHYAFKRLEYADYLVGQSEYELAVMSLFRGHNRLMEAGVASLELENDVLKADALLATTTYNQKLLDIQQQFSEEYKTTFDQMFQENQALQQKLGIVQN